MDAEEKQYIFEVATRNAQRTGLPVQKIVVDKKTLLPSKVSILKEDLTEQIVISFNSIDLKAKHKPEDCCCRRCKIHSRFCDDCKGIC